MAAPPAPQNRSRRRGLSGMVDRPMPPQTAVAVKPALTPAAPYVVLVELLGRAGVTLGRGPLTGACHRFLSLQHRPEWWVFPSMTAFSVNGSPQVPQNTLSGSFRTGMG